MGQLLSVNSVDVLAAPCTLHEPLEPEIVIPPVRASRLALPFAGALTASQSLPPETIALVDELCDLVLGFSPVASAESDGRTVFYFAATSQAQAFYDQCKHAASLEKVEFEGVSRPSLFLLRGLPPATTPATLQQFLRLTIGYTDGCYLHDQADTAAIAIAADRAELARKFPSSLKGSPLSYRKLEFPYLVQLADLPPLGSEPEALIASSLHALLGDNVEHVYCHPIKNLAVVELKTEQACSTLLARGLELKVRETHQVEISKLQLLYLRKYTTALIPVTKDLAFTVRRVEGGTTAWVTCVGSPAVAREAKSAILAGVSDWRQESCRLPAAQRRYFTDRLEHLSTQRGAYFVYRTDLEDLEAVLWLGGTYKSVESTLNYLKQLISLGVNTLCYKVKRKSFAKLSEKKSLSSKTLERKHTVCLDLAPTVNEVHITGLAKDVEAAKAELEEDCSSVGFDSSRTVTPLQLFLLNSKHPDNLRSSLGPAKVRMVTSEPSSGDESTELTQFSFSGSDANVRASLSKLDTELQQLQEECKFAKLPCSFPIATLVACGIKRQASQWGVFVHTPPLESTDASKSASPQPADLLSPAHQWYWEDDKGDFQKYDDEQNQQIDQAYRSGLPSTDRIAICSGQVHRGWLYRITFSPEPFQENLSTTKRRRMRREPASGAVASAAQPMPRPQAPSDSPASPAPTNRLDYIQFASLNRETLATAVSQFNTWQAGLETEVSVPNLPALSPAAIESIEGICQKQQVKFQYLLTKSSLVIKGFKKPALRAEAAVLRLLRSATPSEFPSEWTNLNLDAVELVRVKKSSEEGRGIVQEIAKTLAVKIVRIQRVQNCLLWRKYSKNLELLHAKYRSCAGKPKVMERRLFHGCGETEPSQVYSSESGFMTNFSNGGMWGRGCYFAQDASYSHGYASTTPGGKQFFLAQVLVGWDVSCLKDSTLKTPPNNPATGKAYDSVSGQTSVSGKTSGAKVWIVYENGLAYPQYLITYNLKLS